MLTLSQFGAKQAPPITARAVHKAIQAGRITPRPKAVRNSAGRVTEWRIADHATLAPPRKPGPKGPRKAK